MQFSPHNSKTKEQMKMRNVHITNMIGKMGNNNFLDEIQKPQVIVLFVRNMTTGSFIVTPSLQRLIYAPAQSDDSLGSS